MLEFEPSELHALHQGMEAESDGLFVARKSHVPHYRHAVVDGDLERLTELGAFEPISDSLWRITPLGVRMYSAATDGAK